MAKLSDNKAPSLKRVQDGRASKAAKDALAAKRQRTAQGPLKQTTRGPTPTDVRVDDQARRPDKENVMIKQESLSVQEHPRIREETLEPRHTESATAAAGPLPPPQQQTREKSADSVIGSSSVPWHTDPAEVRDKWQVKIILVVGANIRSTTTSKPGSAYAELNTKPGEPTRMLPEIHELPKVMFHLDGKPFGGKIAAAQHKTEVQLPLLHPAIFTDILENLLDNKWDVTMKMVRGFDFAAHIEDSKLKRTFMTKLYHHVQDSLAKKKVAKKTNVKDDENDDDDDSNERGRLRYALMAQVIYVFSSASPSGLGLHGLLTMCLAYSCMHLAGRNGHKKIELQVDLYAAVMGRLQREGWFSTRFLPELNRQILLIQKTNEPGKLAMPPLGKYLVDECVLDD